MTQKHHKYCPYNDDFQGINNVSECYCGVVIGDDDDMCVCDCMCKELIKTTEFKQATVKNYYANNR